jgi:hypothetical protein
MELPEFLDYVEGVLDDELTQYVYKKFDLTKDAERVREFGGRQVPFANSYWENQLGMYLYRAWTLGLDTPGGRQALMKYVATAIGMLATTVEVYGELPEPGVPSGENLDHLRAFGNY